MWINSKLVAPDTVNLIFRGASEICAQYETGATDTVQRKQIILLSENY